MSQSNPIIAITNQFSYNKATITEVTIISHHSTIHVTNINNNLELENRAGPSDSEA